MLAEKPHTETARIGELRSYAILDTEPEADFDDLVSLLSRLLNVPVALVSLVDTDRQWFKARYGFGSDQTPLEQSICSHAILGTDLFEIEDTQRDPRTADNPLCCGALAEMRFYAGMPLVSPAGYVLGSLCVLDTRPRRLTDLERETLRVMGKQVMRQLDLRRTIANEAVLRDEIDHRVKNSLQTVSSLVRIYRSRASNQEAVEVLDAVQRRIAAVADLHEALYKSDRNDGVLLDGYLARVVDLLHSQAPDGVQVEARVHPIMADPEAAQALAMIISEFAANSFKHAFSDGKTGRVMIHLDEDQGGLRLVCEDTGGATTASVEASSGIGHKLMEAAAAQLGGVLEIAPGPEGYRLTLNVDAQPQDVAAE